MATVLAQEIESKFVFNQQPTNLSYITDDEGQTLKFHTSQSGNQVIFTKDLQGIEVAIEHCADGTKIFHMEQDSKGLPAMHQFNPDGSEIISLFDSTKRLEKQVVMKSNGDKLTTWFSKTGEVITQEQRQTGGILFKMTKEDANSLIWLHTDGSVTSSGDVTLLANIQKVFSRFLDGVDV